MKGYRKPTRRLTLGSGSSGPGTQRRQDLIAGKTAQIVRETRVPYAHAAAQVIAAWNCKFSSYRADLTYATDVISMARAINRRIAADRVRMGLPEFREPKPAPLPVPVPIATPPAIESRIALERRLRLAVQQGASTFNPSRVPGTIPAGPPPVRAFVGAIRQALIVGIAAHAVRLGTDCQSRPEPAIASTR